MSTARHSAAMPRRPPAAEPRSFLDALIRERGISQNELARCLNVHPEEIGRLARGDRGMTREWAERLSPLLNVAKLDLIEGRRRRVALEWHVAAAFSEDRPSAFRTDTATREWFETRQSRPEECFTAVLDDDSADLFGWPASTLLFLRRLEYSGLRTGDMVLVAVGPRGDPFEVLAGRLGQTSEGDLIVTIASSNRHVPQAVIVRYAPSGPGAAESAPRFRHRQEPITYRAAPTDRSEILGVIEIPGAVR